MDIRGLITQYANMYGVDPELALRVAKVESGFNPKAISPKGAIGIMQLMPDTAKMLGVDPYDIEQNIEGGVRYLSGLINQFGDVNLALAAYNAGPEAVKRYGGVPPYQETKQYIKKVNAIQQDVNMPVMSFDVNLLTRPDEAVTQEAVTFPKEMLTRPDEATGNIPKVTLTSPDKVQGEATLPVQILSRLAAGPLSWFSDIPRKAVEQQLADTLAYAGEGMLRPIRGVEQFAYELLGDKEKSKEIAKKTVEEANLLRQTYGGGIGKEAANVVGNIAATTGLMFAPLLALQLGAAGAGATGLASTITRAYPIIEGILTKPVTGGAIAGGLNVVESPDQYWLNKAMQSAFGGLLGGVTGKISEWISKALQKTKAGGFTSKEAIEEIAEAKQQFENIIIPPAKTRGQQAFVETMGKVPGTKTAKIQLENIKSVNTEFNKALQNIRLPDNIDPSIANFVNTKFADISKLFAKEPNKVSKEGISKMSEVLQQARGLFDGKIDDLTFSVNDLDALKSIISALERIERLGTLKKPVKHIDRVIQHSLRKKVSPTFTGQEIKDAINTLGDTIDTALKSGKNSYAQEMIKLKSQLYELFPEDIKATDRAIKSARAFIELLNDDKVVDFDRNINIHNLADKATSKYRDVDKLDEPFKSAITIAKALPKLTEQGAERGIFALIFQSPVLAATLFPMIRATEYMYYKQPFQKVAEATPNWLTRFLPILGTITGGRAGSGLLLP